MENQSIQINKNAINSVKEYIENNYDVDRHINFVLDLFKYNEFYANAIKNKRELLKSSISSGCEKATDFFIEILLKGDNEILTDWKVNIINKTNRFCINVLNKSKYSITSNIIIDDNNCFIPVDSNKVDMELFRLLKAVEKEGILILFVG